MNYELAKELKDAGFPQEGYGDYICECHDRKAEGARDVLGSDHRRAYSPTLEELISACGIQFGSLNRIAGAAWSALNSEGDPVSPPISAPGITPEDAVVMLYLALHGKKHGDKNTGETPRMEGD